MNLEQARANVQNILQGKAINHAPTLAEAKERLRATDPGIDISRPLRQLNTGNGKEAVVDLAFEVGATISLPYLRPLFTAAIVHLYEQGAGKGRRGKKSVEFQGESGSLNSDPVPR